MTIQFFVPGIPKPGGSKRAFFRPGMKYPVIVEACKKTPEWRQAVVAAARAVFTGPLLTGPLNVEFCFQQMRPKGHFGAKGVKASAPVYPTTRPDVLKLARSTEDALTGVVWKDDSQNVTIALHKSYAVAPGCLITIREL